MDRVKKMPFQETNEQAQASSTSSSSPPASFRQKGRRKKRDNPKEPQRTPHKLRSPKSDSSEGDSTTTTTANNSVDSEPPGSPGIPASGREDERAMSSSPTPGVPQRLHCSYCNVYFITKADLQTHCRSQDHQTTIMSDEGRDWSHRPPPRGLGAEDYTLCPTYRAAYTCRMGDQCVEAHSEAELAEWQERFEYRAMKLERAREKQLHGASYADLLLERLSLTQQQDALITEKTDRVISHLSPEPNLRVSQKPSSHEWVITLQPPAPLRVVSLLHDAHRNHFTIAEVTCLDAHRHLHWSCVPENPQEWSSTEQDHQAGPDVKYKVTVSFRTAIYGTFRQAVVFDCGSEPVAMQRLCVDVVPVEDLGALEETKRTILTRSERWCEENVDIVPFDSKPHELSPDDRGILAAYPPPTNENFVFTQTSMERFPTKTNYRSRMHDLLNIEELAQFDLVSRFNIKTTLQITSGYMLLPSTVSTAKYSRPGELFGKLELSSEISEDSHHGRLVLSNCNSMLVASTITPSDSERGPGVETSKPRRCIYEVLIEDKTKKEIYLRFSEQSVAALNLTEDEEATVEVQFQLNRLPLCEMHAALDRLPSLDMIFPDVTMEPTIPWSPIKQWGETLDAKLNPKQKEALVAITAPYGLILPPILIIGPYGTGKTHTLAQGIKQILRQPETRILICTHSNSAADLYIKDYLHPYVKAGHEEARPLRIYYRNRWVTTVHPDVQEYCLIETDVNVRRFVTPTEEQILGHRVIVATLNTSRIIASLKLEKGVFTHILIDEAAQAMECETLMPLALAKPDTRLVLAGDYMQLSPEVFSPFCEERGLGTSLLERLYDLYPADSPCKIMLVENYRSHSAIIKYTSDLFYEGRLVASGKQMAHPKFYPLTFFTARGEDFQDPSSTAFHNNSEVYEVCEQVGEIINYWPKSEWGPVGENSIGVVTPYADQMVRIRAELRKRKLYKISVERVLNVQGKQFRVIILSTVRTRHTCKTGDEGLDFGFLSNAKLLTTAITRAQSLVAVVGDPVSLCSVGKCRKLWERFLQLCSEAGSLYGITWSALRAQLDGVELKKTYGLNPLAPEFVPRYFYYPSLPPLSIVPAVPPYINILPPYSSFIPANYPVHPMVGPQALPYVPHGSPLTPHWSPMPYRPLPKHQIVRPAPARLGQPLIAASHPLRQVAATTAPPGPFLEASGYSYSLPHGVMPMYPYQSGGGPQHRLPVVRRPTDLDSVGRNLFMTALPAHYHHLKQAGPPSSLLGPQSGLRGPRFPNALQLPPAQRQVRLPTHTEGEKTFQFLNNVHFPERQMTPNPSPLIRLPQSHVESESPMSTQSWESSHSSGNDGGPGGRLHGPPAPPSPATPSHLPANLPDPHPHHLHTSHPHLHSHPPPHPLHQPQPHHQPPHQPHLQPQPHPHPHPHPHPQPHPHPHHPQMPPHRDLAPALLPTHLHHQHPSAPQQPAPQRPQSQSNGRVAGEDHAPDIPDVVRAIDELIGDLPPSKPTSWVPYESDVPESRGEARVSSPPIDSWLNSMSVRPSPRLAPPPIGPWSTSSPSAAAKIDVGKMVTVQELEASLHGRQQNHIPGLATPVLSRAPGGPLGNSRDLERVLGVSRDSERLLGEAENNSQVKGPSTGIPPPPGFGGFNSLVDPVSRLDISESIPGYRTPSLPLYLRRGSKETSSRSMSSVGEPADRAMWSIGTENLRMSTSTHGELGLKNMAHSIDNLGLAGSLGLDRRDSKTYAGVLRSSLQTPAAGVEVSKCEESVFSQKELGNKKVHPGNSPLYQYFP